MAEKLGVPTGFSPVSVKFYVKVAVWLIIMAVVWNLPPSGALTEVGMHNLAAFVGLVFGMITLGFIIPCIGALLVMSFSGAYADTMGALSAGFGGGTFIMIFSILLISGIIAYSGLGKIVAMRFVNAKFTAGKPWTLTFIILLVSALLSVFLNPMVTVIIMSGICLEIMKNLEMEKGNKWALMILVSIAVISIIAQDIMPFQSGPAIMNGLMSGLDPRLTIYPVLGKFMLLGVIWLIIMFAFMFFLMRFVCRNSVEKLYNYKPTNEIPPFTRDAKLAGLMLAIYVLVQLVPLAFPQDNAIRIFFGHLGLPGCGFLVAMLAMMIYRKDGSPFILMRQISEHGIEWNILMMLVAIGAISAPMTNEVTGILPWLTGVVSPLANGVGHWGIFVILCFFCIILTNFADNLAICFIIIPVCFTIAAAAGMNTMPMMVWCLYTIQLGIFVPSATPHIAIIFTKEDTGYVTRPRIMKWTAVTIGFEMLMVMSFGWLSYHWFPDLLV